MPVPVPRSKVSPPKSPQSDPKFQRVTGRVNSGAARLKQHPPARSKAAQAQAAAVPPAKEKLAGAQAKQVDKMQQAKPKPVEPNGFLIALRAEIEKVMPQNLDQADSFMEGGEQQQMKGAVTGKVNSQKDEATGEVKASTKQAPDASSVPGKQVTPIPGEPAPATPQINAGEGMPSPKPEAEVTQKEYSQNADQQLKDAEVTPTQLSKANDPRFSAVLTAKDQVDKTANAAPGKYRAAEKGTLVQASVKAQADARTGAAALVGAKTRSGAAVRTRQNASKERDEKRRKEVTDTIEGIYTATKTSVEAKLSGLESQVSTMFDAGANAAIANMKDTSKREIELFKDDRYSGVTGKASWLADLFRPVPQEIKNILARNRVRFTQEMDRLVVSIANIVETRLREAKGEIDKGQTKIKAYVASLPRDLQAVGRAAEQEVAGRFDELRQGVDEKKNDLAQKLAQKYKEASDKADTELKKIEEENAGALRGLIDKLAEIIKILADFKDKLMSLIRKGMATIKLIIADPIGFLSNLIAAIKAGFQQFVANIWAHLKKGFMQWLFGALAGAGIEIPSDLSLPSILKLVLGVLGITYERMRAKAVKLLGPTAVAIIEKVVEYVKALIQGGPAALWEKVKEDLGNLKAMVIDAIQTWLIDTIVKQAVAKVLSMFNPAGAIVQAIIAIYNVVMFVIERASQIMAFVEAVINSVHSIATGAIGSAANWIEQSLARLIPLVIGFLARLIGLGGISQKIKEFITKVQSKVDAAIDKAIAKVVAVVKKLFGAGGGDKAKEKGTVEERWKKGMAAVEKYVAKGAKGDEFDADEFKGGLPAIQSQFGFTKLVLVEQGAGFAIDAEMNPKTKKKVDDSKLVVKSRIPPPPGAVPPPKFKDFKKSSRGNMHLYYIDQNDTEWHWEASGKTTGTWRKINDNKLQKKAEEAARKQVQGEFPGFKSLVESDKGLTAAGLDVAGLAPAQAAKGRRPGRPATLVIGEVKAFKGSKDDPRYVQYTPSAQVGTLQPSGRERENKLSAITDNLRDNLAAAMPQPTSQKKQQFVNQIEAAIKSGNILIRFYLAGSAVISADTIEKVKRRVRMTITAMLKQPPYSMSPDEISKIIGNVEVDVRRVHGVKG